MRVRAAIGVDVTIPQGTHHYSNPELTSSALQLANDSATRLHRRGARVLESASDHVSEVVRDPSRWTTIEIVSARVSGKITK